MENQNPPFPPPPPGNPYQQNPMGGPMGNPMGMQTTLPNSVGVLVLGIVSIVMCWCYGIIGIACGIIALVLAGKANQLYNENPNLYTMSSFNNMKAGRVCAIIGLSLSILWLIYCIFALVMWGGRGYYYQYPWQRF